MNKNLQMVYTYHNETKHSQQRYAKSLGYMDWNTQPNPFRIYNDTIKTPLILSFDNHTLEYSQIFNQSKNDKLSAPFCIESISQFFQFSLGLAAIKEFQEQSWALRCNASSGNLHPTEAYIISNNIQNIQDGLHHYSPKNHELELLSKTTKKINLPDDSFLVCLSSIVWREAWKYGERAWRYTQLDCGHALKALEISALTLGWEIEIISTQNIILDNLLGFDQEHRYIPQEKESADMLLLVSKKKIANIDSFNINEIKNSLEKEYFGKANQLSINWHKWDILDKIENATINDSLNKKEFINNVYDSNPYRQTSLSTKEIILKRRSVQMMDKDNCNISKKEFETILASISSLSSPIHLVIFVHNVDKLESGMYILIRNKKCKIELQKLMKDDFLWEKVDTKAGELYKLQNGDFKFLAKAISCNQDIASDSAFSLGMLAQFEEQLKSYGPSRYKQLYWECGAIGQQLYLESTSLNLSATGIGCFLDDIVHNTLGLKTFNYQTLYHFTIGRGIIDNRLTTKKPYIDK